MAAHIEIKRNIGVAPNPDGLALGMPAEERHDTVLHRCGPVTAVVVGRGLIHPVPEGGAGGGGGEPEGLY